MKFVNIVSSVALLFAVSCAKSETNTKPNSTVTKNEEGNLSANTNNNSNGKIECTSHYEFDYDQSGSKYFNKVYFVFRTNDIISSSVSVVQTQVQRNDIVYNYNAWSNNSGILQKLDLHPYNDKIGPETVLVFKEYSENSGLPVVTSIAVPYPFKYNTNGEIIFYYAKRPIYNSYGYLLANDGSEFSIDCSSKE